MIRLKRVRGGEAFLGSAISGGAVSYNIYRDGRRVGDILIAPDINQRNWRGRIALLSQGGKYFGKYTKKFGSPQAAFRGAVLLLKGQFKERVTVVSTR